MPPRIGLLVDIDVTDPSQAVAGDVARHVVALAGTAEGAGFDGVFYPDRHMRPTTVAPSQLVNVAGAVATTERVDVGTYCSVLPLYNPMEFAEAWAHLDQLSGGRAVVALGAGYNAEYQRFFGLAGAPHRRRFLEALEVVRRAWTERAPWSHHGEAFTYDEVVLHPAPLQAGGPPVWVAGQGEWAVTLACEVGDGIAGDPFPLAPALWHERARRFEDAARARGVDRPELAMLRHVYVSDDDAEVSAVLEEVCLPLLRFYESAGLLRGRLDGSVHDRIDERLARDTTIVGSLDACAEQLGETIERYGLTYLILKVMRPQRLSVEGEAEMVSSLGDVLGAVRASAP